MATFDDELREIINDCVITGYTNANDLIEKSITAIKEAIRKRLPEKESMKQMIGSSDTDEWSRRTGYNQCREETRRNLGV